MENMYVKLKQNINKDDYKRIKNLEDICLKNDNTSLKLELDYKLNTEKINSLKEINEFMCFYDELLVGYLGICQFSKNTIEVNGMVHPLYRRKKIFTKLFSLLLDEFNKREVENMLLLCDEKSESGLEFIKSTNSKYDSSEYEMYYNNNYIIKDSLNVKLRKATNEDVKEIAKQSAIYFGGSNLNLSNIEEEEKFGRFIFIALVNNSIIGKVNIEVNDKLGAVYGLGVLPKYRNKGYGKEILNLVLKKLKEHKVDDIKLQVLVDNKNALNLYLSCGFEVTSTMGYYKIKKGNII